MITNVLEYIERCADQEVKGQVSFFTDDRERVLYSEMVESARRVGSMLLDEKLSRQPIAVYLPKSIMELKCFGELFIVEIFMFQLIMNNLLIE